MNCIKGENVSSLCVPGIACGVQSNDKVIASGYNDMKVRGPEKGVTTPANEQTIKDKNERVDECSAYQLDCVDKFDSVKASAGA